MCCSASCTPPHLQLLPSAEGMSLVLCACRQRHHRLCAGALNKTERAELPLTKRQRRIIGAISHLSKAWWFRRLLAAVYAVPRVQRLVFETGMKGWVSEAATKMTEGDIECFRKP